MNELATRTVFGLLYAAVVVAGVYFHPYGLLALLVIIFFVGLTEMKHLLADIENNSLYLTTTFLGIFGLLVHLSFSADGQNHLLAFIAFILFALFVQHLFTKGSELDVKRLLNINFSFVYLFLPTSLAISIAYLDGIWEPAYLLGLFFVIWANDTSAYLVGRAIGKHKLIERLSPKKSIEGLMGGIAGAMLAGYILSHLFDALTVPEWMIYAAIIAIASNIGDLFQSSLKRAAGVKDSGNFIPGHGGILDRLDSFLLSVPIAYFYLRFFT